MDDKYLNEIESILENVGVEKGNQRNNNIGNLRSLGRRISTMVKNTYDRTSRLLFGGLCLLLTAILVSAIVPGIIGPILWLGLIGLLLISLMFSGRNRENVEKRWRGRVITPKDSGISSVNWWRRAARRIKKTGL